MSKSKRRTAIEPLSPRERGRGEGSAEAKRLAKPEPSSDASRHLLPEGEGKTPTATETRHSRESGNDESIFQCTLPADWKRAPVATNYRITKKARGFTLNQEKSLPFISMECVPAGGQTACGFELRKPSAIVSGIYFETGDVLLSKITPSFENGKQGIASGLPGNFGYGSTEIIPLQSYTNDAINLYLFYLLLHHEIRDSLASKMEGSTGRKRVPEGAVRELKIPVPPKLEQQKIAAVLWKMQRAIATQDRLIAVTRDLKQSAMQHLFTHGLRGEPLKDTAIGPMPKNWSARSVLELCHIYSGGTPRKSVPEYWAGDIPWVSGKDLKAVSLDDAIDHVSADGIAAGSRLAPADSVLLLVRGMGLAKDLPVAVITRPMAFNQDLKALISRGELSGEFLRSAIYTGKDRLLDRIVASAHGTMTLNLNDVETFELACPSDPKEANAIAAALATLDRKLAHHRQKRAALNDLFQTTLHQLMTAQIRVTDLDIDTAEATTPQPQGMAA